MKRILAISIALLALSLAAFAQHGRGPVGGPANGSAGPGRKGIVEYLGLTDEQKTQWDALHEQFRTSTQVLFDQQKALREQIDTLLDADTPDPVAIGTLVIQQRALREQIRDAHDALQASLKAILTAEQLTKFEAFLAARGEGPHGGRHGGEFGGSGPCGVQP